MHSTPSYFKLKSQLRLAAEYDPSTCIEFELRCNSAASNLRYKTVLPHSGYVYSTSVWVTNSTLEYSGMFSTDAPMSSCPRDPAPKTTATSVLDQSAIRKGVHRPTCRWLDEPTETNLITARSATAACNRRARLPAYRPSGVPLANGTRRNRAAPRFILTNSVQHDRAPDPGPWGVTSGLA